MYSTFTMNAQNLLATYNEGFEGINPGATGNTPYYWWNFYNDAAASATLTDETVMVRTGGHAAKVVVGAAAASYQPQLANGRGLTLTVGSTYTATFWIRGVAGGGKVQTSNNGSSLYGPQMTVTTAWQQYSHTFVADAASYQLWISLGGFVDTYYVDDASVVLGGTLGVDAFSKKSISFYPNPVTDNLNISSETYIKSVTVSDLNGKTVKTFKSANNIQSVNLSELSQGVYILSTDTNEKFKFLKN